MSDENEDRLAELFEQARALRPDARAAFLADACGSDTKLEQEVLSLLEHGESAEAFFATLAHAVDSPSAGHQIGHYRLLGMLGAGGMGTVYRAHDERLDRIVALKFLPAHLSAQPEAREQFLAEARAAAALDHPEICTIHEIGETAAGRPFIAMACYDGETLRERLGCGPLPPNEAIRIALALARGLAAAHTRGIVHRDVKPGNVMLCTDGTVRLLDFGLAKAADSRASSAGITQGTIAYMSPEQVRGDEVDARTDLWSLGVVLHEMLTGTRPVSDTDDRKVLPASLQRIVSRLLQKNPDDRYASADALTRDLARRAPTRTATKVIVGLVAVAALLVVGFGIYRNKPAPLPIDAPANALTVAVLPFTVHGTGLDVWREGLVDLLSTGLDGAAGIRAIDSRTLLARWHEELGDRPTADLAFALGIARQTHARFALVGAVVATGSRLRLSADIYDVVTGAVVGPVQVEGPADSVLVLVDRAGMQTLGVILEKNPGEVPALELAAFTTNSLLALREYLEGAEHFRRSEFNLAAGAWERAVRADTLFALAHLGLADARAWVGDYVGFMESLNRAKQLEARLPGRERAMMEIRWERENRTADATPTIRDALRKYPDAADMWYELGEVYYHDAVAMGRPEDAEAAFQHAVALQPLMAPYQEHLLELAFAVHPDSASLATALATYARAAPSASATRAGRIALALAFGNDTARARAVAEVGTLDSEAGAALYLFLSHPRFAPLREDVYRAIAPRLTRKDQITVQDARFHGLALTEGRLHDALEVLAEPGTRPTMRYGGTAYLLERGMPVPESLVKETIASARSDSALWTSRNAVVLIASAAAKLADWTSYDALMVHLRELAARGRTDADTVRVKYWEWAIRFAEGHGLWRHGRKEEALRRFESTLSDDQSWLPLWSVAELSLELGQLERAERAFRTLTLHDITPAYLQLARVLARTGRTAEAREAYRFVASAWRNADAALRPEVDEADRAIGRLSVARSDSLP